MNTKSADQDMDLTRICEQYCQVRPLRPATKVSYERIVRIFIRDTAVRHLDKITKETLIAWRDMVAQRSSTTTYNTYHRHLCALFNYCLEQDLIKTNPMHMIKPFTRVNTRRKGCSLEDLQQFCNYLETASDPMSSFYLNIVLTLFYTGMRRSQICGLIWRDIDFEESTVLLRKQHSKNGREWKIPLHEDLYERLSKFKDEAMERFPDFTEQDQVFWIQRYSTRYEGARLTPNHLSGIMRRTSDRCGVKISAHMIRHLVATTLANADPDEYHEKGAIPYTLNSIRDLLGHENIATTIGYIESKISTQRRIIKGLEMGKRDGKGD